VKNAARAFLLAVLSAGPRPALADPPSRAAAPAADEAAYAAEARAVVEDVLSTSEFNGPVQRSQFWQHLKEWLGKLFGAIGRGVERFPGWVAWLLVAWLLLALVAILGHLLYVLWGLAGARGRNIPATTADRRETVLLCLATLDYEQAQARALALAEAHDWSAAIQHLYVAAILWLDRAGLIAYRRVKTNLDLLRELARYPACHAEFGRLTNVFEATIYGGRPAGETQLRTMTAALEALRQPHAPSND
jgi:hypothetical protein